MRSYFKIVLFSPSVLLKCFADRFTISKIKVTEKARIEPMRYLLRQMFLPPFLNNLYLKLFIIEMKKSSLKAKYLDTMDTSTLLQKLRFLVKEVGLIFFYPTEIRILWTQSDGDGKVIEVRFLGEKEKTLMLLSWWIGLIQNRNSVF